MRVLPRPARRLAALPANGGHCLDLVVREEVGGGVGEVLPSGGGALGAGRSAAEGGEEARIGSDVGHD